MVGAVVALLCACAVEEGGAGEPGASGVGAEDTGEPATGMPTTGPGSGPATTAPSDEPETTDPDEPLFDISTALDIPEDGPCQKVDFLFVIDSSGSMQTHQENLVGSFGGFMDAIESTLEFADDFHVMVVDSDANAAEVCDWWCDVGSPFCPYTCYASMDPEIWQECDRTVGAGVRYPLGLHSSGTDCGFPEGRRYLQSGDEDLREKFACAALVGASHTDEWQMDAVVASVGPELNAPGGCNEGFLRDDAVLVLTLITDEPDTQSMGDVMAWRDAVVEAKGGNENAVVLLALISDVGLEDPACTNVEGFPSESPNMHEFADLFMNSSKASICEESYAPFLEASVALIDDVCDSFVPAG